jgi:hypothetical protein
LSYNRRSSRLNESRSQTTGWPMWGMITLGVGCFLIVVLGSVLGFLILSKDAKEQDRKRQMAQQPPVTPPVTPPQNPPPVQPQLPPVFPPPAQPQANQFDDKFQQPPTFPDPMGLTKREPEKKEFLRKPPEPKKPETTIEQDGYTLMEKEKVFEPKNECFTILLPAGEKVRTSHKLLDIGRHGAPVESGSSTTGNNIKSAGSIIHGGTPLMKLSDTELSDLIAEALYKTKEGKLKGKKDIKQDDIGGREYLMEFPDGAIRLQIYVIGGITVMATVEDSSLDNVRSDDADKFLRGLKFTEKTKKIYKDTRRK